MAMTEKVIYNPAIIKGNKDARQGTMEKGLQIPIKAIQAFCAKWKIVEFALFGSAVREDFNPDSDVDVLVSFAPHAGWTLHDLMDMQDELTALFGRHVDLVEKEGLRNPFRRKAILAEAEVIYAG